MRRSSFVLVCVAAVGATVRADAAEPRSKVTSFTLSLGTAGTFSDKDSLAKSTVNMVVDPKLPSWTKQGDKLVVPSCSVSLNGPLVIQGEFDNCHKSSMLHWTIDPNLGGGSAGLQGGSCAENGAAKTLGDDSFQRQWNVSLPVKAGLSMYNVQAWTSKQGEKSVVKGLLLKLTCEDAPKPPPVFTGNVNAPGLGGSGAPSTIKPGTPIDPGKLMSALEVRGLAVDIGLPDANAIEWFKGQPTDKQIFFHEITGPGSEPGGTKWGAVQAVTVNGQTLQSRGIDSCRSALKLKKYVVSTRNNGGGAYPASPSNDVRAQTTGASGGAIVTSGKLGSIAPNTQATLNLDAAAQGVVMFPSGTFTVKAELLPPAASSTPENNTAQLGLQFKCKALNATTWQ